MYSCVQYGLYFDKFPPKEKKWVNLKESKTNLD